MSPALQKRSPPEFAVGLGVAFILNVGLALAIWFVVLHRGGDSGTGFSGGIVGLLLGTAVIIGFLGGGGRKVTWGAIIGSLIAIACELAAFAYWVVFVYVE